MSEWHSSNWPNSFSTSSFIMFHIASFEVTQETVPPQHIPPFCSHMALNPKHISISKVKTQVASFASKETWLDHSLVDVSIWTYTFTIFHIHIFIIHTSYTILVYFLYCISVDVCRLLPITTYPHFFRLLLSEETSDKPNIIVITSKSARSR